MRSTAACPKIIYEYIVHVRIMCYVKIRSEKNRRRLTTISIYPCFIAVFALLFSIRRFPFTPKLRYFCSDQFGSLMHAFLLPLAQTNKVRILLPPFPMLHHLDSRCR
jgi:uncharacterized membrane protein YjdF